MNNLLTSLTVVATTLSLYGASALLIGAMAESINVDNVSLSKGEHKKMAVVSNRHRYLTVDELRAIGYEI